jgi:site-specific DNA-methyltransferase (adenine-specific)
LTNDVLFSSDKQDWETPQWLFDLLDDEYQFSLDPCATPENAKCWHYYTPKDNGLKRVWSGNVWVNPPYDSIVAWLERAVLQLKYKRIETIVFLIPARTDTKYWHKYVMKHACEIRFIEGRLRFVGAKGAAPFPSVIVIFNRQRRRSWPYILIGKTINARGK